MWEFTQSQWNRKQNIGCKYWVYDLLFCKQVTIFNIHICPELRSSWTCKLLATLLLCQLVISLKAKSLFICFYLPNVLMTLDCNFVFLSSLLQCLLYFPFSQYFITFSLIMEYTGIKHTLCCMFKLKKQAFNILVFIFNRDNFFLCSYI